MPSQNRPLIEKIKKYDENGDNVTDLNEFRCIMRDIEPAISDELSFFLFKETLKLSSKESGLSDAI